MDATVDVGDKLQVRLWKKQVNGMSLRMRQEQPQPAMCNTGLHGKVLLVIPKNQMHAATVHSNSRLQARNYSIMMLLGNFKLVQWTCHCQADRLWYISIQYHTPQMVGKQAMLL